MVRISFEQKPFRKVLMRIWGAHCIPSPSQDTQAGRDILKKMPDTPGSLGIAISEAIEEAVSDTSGKTRYALGSVLNHVMLHQSIIGLETRAQLKKVGIEKPDIIIGCAGGGSNFAGLAFPFAAEKIDGADITIKPVEPKACPTLTRGEFIYDYGDVAKTTPLLPMYSLGHTFVPPGIHAGGLRYHGMAPLVSQAVVDGLFEPVSLDQLECYDAALTWARTEGSVPAPETTHAIAATIREALKAREEGKEKDIVFCYSGHGLLDLSAYETYLDGQLVESTLPEDDLQKSISDVKDNPRVE